jgi:hypothetical protein
MRFPTRPHSYPLAAALALAALALISAPPATADSLLTLESHRGGAPGAEPGGGPAAEEETSTVEMWIGDGRIRRDDGRVAMVLDGDRLLLINHDEETYSVLELPIDLESMLPEEMRRMAATWKPQISVEPSEESREIGGWKARRWDVEVTSAMGLAIHNRLWVTRDLDIDYAAFEQLTRAMASLQPGGGAAMDQLAAIDGFPVLVESTADFGGRTMESSERLVSVERREPPAGLYQPPDGYTETPFDPAADAPRP